jgi:hypothetical protein
VEVWDEDKFKKDDFIGRVGVKIEQRDETVSEVWKKLESKYVVERNHL